MLRRIFALRKNWQPAVTGYFAFGVPDWWRIRATQTRHPPLGGKQEGIFQTLMNR